MRSKQGQGIVKRGSKQGQGKAKVRSRRGQGKVKVKSSQYSHNLNRNYNLMGFDTIEINLVVKTPTQRQLNNNSTKVGFVVKTPTQRQLNNNSTKVGFDTKMTVHTHPTPPHPPPQKLNVCNISAVTDPILTKL